MSQRSANISDNISNWIQNSVFEGQLTCRQHPREFASLEVNCKPSSNLTKTDFNLTGTVKVFYIIDISIAELLIEPVWNRNIIVRDGDLGRLIPF